MKKPITIFQLSIAGLMAALVFVASMISVPIPVAIGPATRIHLGNIFCLLSGFLLGPVLGGLSAGIGSFLFDLMNPQYIADSPFTFLFKFLLAFVCAKFAYSHDWKGINTKMNFIAAALGSFTYIILYVGKGFIENTVFLRMEIIPALAIVWTKLGASSVNAIIAVIVSVPLCLVIRTSLKGSKILNKF